MPSSAPSGANQMQNEVISQHKPEISLKDRFFRYFQHEITALQEQMERLGDTALIGGERTDAIDHCLAGIARLSSEVKDASASIPPYDQRIYANAIKALQDKLAEARASFAPRSKFSFKTARKNPSAISLADAAEIAAQGRRHIPGYRSNDNSMQSSASPSPILCSTSMNDRLPSPQQEASAPLEAPQELQKSDTDKPSSSVSGASSVFVSSHTGVHIVLPTSASHATVPASITSLHHCVVDMTVPTADGRPFAGLVIKGVTESLLLCGQVDGPAHITGVKHSTIVVSCHQFRMHDCVDVDVYLSCSSRPIIEDCSNIRFGNIPEIYAPKSVDSTQPNLWDQVQDFKWIKVEQSPNWSIINESEIVPHDVWENIVPGGPGASVDTILKSVKVILS
ncbi:tubulin-specific chaperone c [Histoplasma capsulatum var. duboisii H88]|uniref:Tubulin-specific chaperone c n=1 Tax=Ajellomyces capsulatus (strain H88) TaxID=544711 RepID=F0UJG4_AJEC8|nr:tubulin-specific chaperone c [Histoplasma capsulatum var. duboisii H88]QSS56408.1 tubulin-specific chaperone c [Histoplasma capsulatum var. duboisii H88]